MIGLQNRITVTVIRNAAGSQSGSTMAGCRDSAPSYYAAARLSTELPSACGANSYNLYDPSMPRKVINVMNYFGAPSSDFVPFNRTNLVESIDLNCELQPGDEIVCIWKPLLVLGPSIVGVSPVSVGTSNKTVVPPTPVIPPTETPAPVDPSPIAVTPPKVTVKKQPKSRWLPTYGIYFKPPEV